MAPRVRPLSIMPVSTRGRDPMRMMLVVVLVVMLVLVLVVMLVKQVTTLPWHITPKGTLYGPIYGIYMGEGISYCISLLGT